MKLRQKSYSALLSLLVFGVAGCMTTPPQEDPVLIKLAEIDRRLAALERVVQNDSLINLAASVDGIQRDVDVLRGQVEELEFAGEGAQTRQRDLYVDLDKRIQAIEQGNAVPTVSSATGLPVPGGSDEGNYRAAFDLLKDGQYDQAATAFERFLSTYPDSTLADNAQYWLAESYYVSQKYTDALAAFQTVVERFPSSAKMPDALLKIGYCNYELTNWDAARTALTRVEREYSDTTAARLASQRLGRMRDEGR